jgi:hypothetical protein
MLRHGRRGQKEGYMGAKKQKRRTGPAPHTSTVHASPFVFTYRCPARLIGPLNEARFVLREPTRTGLVTKAIEEYLQKRRIPLEVVTA